MMRFYGASNTYGTGKKTILVSPKIATDKDYVFSFWMQRDSRTAFQSADKVNVYVNSTPVANATPVLTVNRYIGLDPVEEEGGWHRYSVLLNTSEMEDGAFVILEAVKGNAMIGGDMYIDDIAIYDPYAPVSNIKSSSTTTSITLTWDYLGDAASFEISKNGLAVDTVDVLVYADEDLIGGGVEYNYCVRPVYDSVEATPVCIDARTADCDPVPVTNLEATGDRLNKTISLVWECAEEGVRFEVYRNEMLIATLTETSYEDASVEYSINYTYCVKPVSEVCVGGAADCETLLLEAPKPSGLGSINQEMVTIHQDANARQISIAGNDIRVIAVYNVAGQLLKQVEQTSNKAPVFLNLSDYQAGVYLFKIQLTDGLSVTKKVVIHD
jgi:hypothetical protein